MLGHSSEILKLNNPQVSTTEEQAKNPCIQLSKYFSNTGRCFKSSLIYAISIATGVSWGVYGLLYPSGQSPSELGKKTWWNSMSDADKFFSLVTGTTAFIMDAIANTTFLPDALKKFKKDTSLCRNKPKKIILISSTHILAFSNALASGALAYQAMEATGVITSSLMGVSQAISLYIRRYVSIVKIFNQIADFFNCDKQFQNKCMTDLYLIKSEYKDIFNASLAEVNLINEEIIKELFFMIYDKALNLETVEKQSLFSVETKNNRRIKNVGKIFDALMGILFASFNVPFWGQQGFNAVNIIYSNASTSNTLNTLARSEKIAITILPGFAAALQAFVNGCEFRRILFTAMKYMQQGKIEFLKAVLTLVFGGLAITSLASAARNTVENNIYGIGDDNYGETFIIINTLSSFCLVMSGVINKLMTIDEKPNGTVALNDASLWLKNNKLSKKTLGEIKAHYFFECRVPKQKIVENEFIAPPFPAGVISAT